MNARWTIRIGAVVFAIGLLGSTAFAMKTETGSGDAYQRCGITCEHAITQTLDESYPAQQPLEVCDDVCIFY